MTEIDLYNLAQREIPTWFRGPYNLNLLGFRAPADGTNLFDDCFAVAGEDDAGRPFFKRYRCTTDPGRKSLDHPTRVAGTFTLAPQRVKGMWEIGLHKGKYPALHQAPGAILYGWRGSDRTKLYHDAEGINCHHAAGATRVDWYSAGCQTLQLTKSLDEVLTLCRLQIARKPSAKTFSYELIDVGDRPRFAPMLEGIAY